MILHVLAVDYDGTIAEAGRVSETTAAALARVRESGRRLVLVTGRLLPDLRALCPDLDTMFDAVVAENGALLYLPQQREIKTLGDPPEPKLVEALRGRGVPFDLGSSIIGTGAAFAEPALAAIRETGVQRTLVFNKGSLMLLPGGVTKGTGLLAALTAMELSPHSLAGIGDAENDHAFLALCECAVAVADAIPALRERADYVTARGDGSGVVEFIDEHLLNDAQALVPGLRRHHVPLGQTAEGEPVTIGAHATTLLIVGPSATGKSTLTGVLVERLIEAGRSLCVLDPEGDHLMLAELPGVVAFGGKARQTLPALEELRRLLRRPDSRLILNLSGMSMAEKVDYATQALTAVASVRSASGLPHWLVVDEAHHIAPAEGSTAGKLLRGSDSLGLITLAADHLAPDVRRAVSAVASTDLDALGAALAVLRAEGTPGESIPVVSGDPLERGEAILALLGRPPRAVRFRVARRVVEHRRHIRKYAEGELPPDRSFYFRGPERALNLRAANLKRFCELAEGVDAATWTHHLRRGEYSEWMREMIKDPELADEVAALEQNGAERESRRLVLEAIRRRYAV